MARHLKTIRISNNNAPQNLHFLIHFVYVPEGSLSSYQAAEQWKEFFFVEEGDGEQEIPGEPEEKKCAKPSIHYSNGKLMFECDTEGATFVITQFQITPPSVGEVAGNTMNLALICNVSFYAKATGYENSDIVTQTLTLEGDGFDPNGDGKPTLKDITRFIDLYLHSKWFVTKGLTD